MNMKKFILCFLGLFCLLQLFATTLDDDKKQKFVYPQKETPVGIDNYLFSTYYYSGKKTYNLRNSVLSSSGQVADMKINPSGSSFAVLSVKGKKATVTWKKISGAAGYQVTYGTKKSLKKAKTVTVNASKSKAVIRKLKNKKYYVRVRAFKTYRGQTFYGSYSKVKKVTIR